MTDDEIVERLLADQRLLRLPLVRRGNDVSAGPAEATWRSWLARPD
jgi:arsenate reductase-like glutaredoxin family protein